MAKWFSKQDKLIQFLICVLLVLMVLFLFKTIFEKSEYVAAVNETSSVKKTHEEYENKYSKIDITYPKFTNIKVNNIIKKYIENYILDFKNDAKENQKNKVQLQISYKIHYYNNYLLIYFKINDGMNLYVKNKSIIINTKESKEVGVSDFVKNDYLFKKLVLDKVNKKYSKDVYNKVKDLKINDYAINIENNRIFVTFNNVISSPVISYIPEISLPLKQIRTIFNKREVEVFDELKEEKENTQNYKYIALTFDDGPNSESTNKILDTLLENNEHATFFSLGSRMKWNKEVILREIALGNEVGSHTYSHKNLSHLTKAGFETEMNSTNILFTEITKKNIGLLRPPYGSINDFVKENSPYPLILWNVDTLDWSKLDAKKVSEHVLQNAKDGDIILMHDIYNSTAEAVKIMIPELKNKGFKMVTVSELAKIKKVNLKKGEIYRSFN